MQNLKATKLIKSFRKKYCPYLKLRFFNKFMIITNKSDEIEIISIRYSDLYDYYEGNTDVFNYINLIEYDTESMIGHGIAESIHQCSDK